MTRYLLHQRIRWWEHLQDCLFETFICSLVLSVMGIIVGVVVIAFVLAWMNATQGMSMRFSESAPTLTILFLLAISLSAVLGFLSNVAGIMVVLLARSAGKTGAEYSTSAVVGKIAAMVLTGGVAGTSLYFAFYHMGT